MTDPSRDDGFACDLALLHAPADAEAARALAAALSRQGARLAWMPPRPPAGGMLDDQLARSRWVLVLWSAASRPDTVLVARAHEAMNRQALLPVRLDVGDAPEGLSGLPEASLSGWQGDEAEPVFNALTRSLALMLGLLSQPHTAALAATAPTAPGLLGRLRRLWQRVGQASPAAAPARAGLPLGPAADPPPDHFERTVPLARSGVSAPGGTAPLPVWIGASAPRHAAAGQQFVARLGLFTEPMRAAVQAALAALVDDLPPDAGSAAPGTVWLEGAPLTVVLDGGADLQVSPPRRQLAWNGRGDIAGFSVTVDPGTPNGPQTLHFQLLLAGVPLAYLSLPLRIERANVATALAVPLVEPARPLPRSLWLAVSAGDTADMAQRAAQALSWAPTLRLQAGDLLASRAERERAIGAADALLLCWSARAAADPEVAWALRCGWSALGPEAVLPMPLDDPHEAWPPAEYAEGIWRERFLMAWIALAPPPELDLPAPTIQGSL